MQFSRSVRLLAFCLAALGAAIPASAQTTPSTEVSAGYQFLNLSVDGESESLGKGWYFDVAGNLSRHLGIVFQAGGNYKSITESVTVFGVTGTATVDLKVHEFLGGVRVSARQNSAIVPFGQVLVGAVNGSAEITSSSSIGGTTLASFTEEDSGTDFGLQVGGGLNLGFTDNVGVRVGGDYLRIFEEGGGGNLFRFHVGIVVAGGSR